MTLDELELGCPKDLPDDLARVCWASALRASLDQPEIQAAFKAATGMSYTPPRSVLESLIDEASGYPERFLRTYIEWFNTHVWGPWDGPIDEEEAEG